MANKGDIILVDTGHLSESAPNRGVPVLCYVCGTPHKGSGLARIREKTRTTYKPLCDPCVKADATENAVIRKFLESPELKVSEASSEQFAALVERKDKTRH